mmetsp:Transcript_10306/g.15737  ORF Transcript_10306/g.15737 Transcript_10306/m.15737 type:complete len:118 (-) Transcript_10306:383-736(-)
MAVNAPGGKLGHRTESDCRLGRQQLRPVDIMEASGTACGVTADNTYAAAVATIVLILRFVDLTQSQWRIPPIRKQTTTLQCSQEKLITLLRHLSCNSLSCGLISMSGYQSALQSKFS